jgi:MraZ protein
MLGVRCQANVVLDGKGRLALPAPIRRALEEAGKADLVLTFVKGAIWGWTREDWIHQVEAPLAKADPFDDRVVEFAQAVVAPSQDVEVDNQGRVRLPPLLRELAGIERDVVVHSVLQRLEFWDKATWEEQFRASLARVAHRSGLPVGRSEGGA